MRHASRILPVALAAAVLVSAAPARGEESGSRWVAALPFGVGQIQNGDVGLGVFLAVAEGLFGTASVVTSVMVNRLASTSVGPSIGPTVDVAELNTHLRTLATVNRIGFAGWAALAVGGVVEAEVSYGPRHPPLAPAVTATVAPLVGGGMIGVRGLF